MKKPPTTTTKSPNVPQTNKNVPQQHTLKNFHCSYSVSTHAQTLGGTHGSWDRHRLLLPRSPEPLCWGTEPQHRVRKSATQLRQSPASCTAGQRFEGHRLDYYLYDKEMYAREAGSASSRVTEASGWKPTQVASPLCIGKANVRVNFWQTLKISSFPRGKATEWLHAVKALVLDFSVNCAPGFAAAGFPWTLLATAIPELRDSNVLFRSACSDVPSLPHRRLSAGSDLMAIQLYVIYSRTACFSSKLLFCRFLSVTTAQHTQINSLRVMRSVASTPPGFQMSDIFIKFLRGVKQKYCVFWLKIRSVHSSGLTWALRAAVATTPYHAITHTFMQQWNRMHFKPQFYQSLFLPIIPFIGISSHPQVRARHYW